MDRLHFIHTWLLIVIVPFVLLHLNFLSFHQNETLRTQDAFKYLVLSGSFISLSVIAVRKQLFRHRSTIFSLGFYF